MSSSATTFGWFVLLCPLVGMFVLSLGWRVIPARAAGWIGTLAIALSFAFAVAMLLSLFGHSADHRKFTSTLWSYAVTAGVDAKLSIYVDPLSVFMALIVSGVSTMIHLYSVTYMKSDIGVRRYFAYLNYFVFSMLLLVLAGNFLLLIVGWAFVGAASVSADLVLVPAHDRDERRAEGVPDQCVRRRWPRARDVLHPSATPAVSIT